MQSVVDRTSASQLTGPERDILVSAPFRMLSNYGSTCEPRSTPLFRVTYRNVEPDERGGLALSITSFLPIYQHDAICGCATHRQRLAARRRDSDRNLSRHRDSDRPSRDSDTDSIEALY